VNAEKGKGGRREVSCRTSALVHPKRKGYEIKKRPNRLKKSPLSGLREEFPMTTGFRFGSRKEGREGNAGKAWGDIKHPRGDH